MLFLERIINLRDKQLQLQYREYQEQLDKGGKIVYISIAEEYYTEKGIEKGIAQGVEKEKCEIAKKLFARGESPESISEITELPIDQVRGLIQ
jgi:predicted transposase/invertase (TIGR01784 family)